MTQAILLVSGSRAYQGFYAQVASMVQEVTESFRQRYPDHELVLMHGDCPSPPYPCRYSIDEVADHVGRILDFRIERRPADWRPNGGALPRTPNPVATVTRTTLIATSQGDDHADTWIRNQALVAQLPQGRREPQAVRAPQRFTNLPYHHRGRVAAQQATAEQ